MKKIFLITLIGAFSCQVKAQDFDFAIGKMKNNNPVLTLNTTDACKSLSKNLLSASSIKETFTKAEIIKVGDNYALVFSGAKYKTTFAVKVIEGTMFAKVKVSCTTSGKDCLRDGTACTPSSNVGECACTACTGDEVCTKTCSSESLIN